MTTALAGRTITIGTRGSALALVQTEIVRAAILAARPELTVEVRRITTRGDAILDRSLVDAAVTASGDSVAAAHSPRLFRAASPQV